MSNFQKRVLSSVIGGALVVAFLIFGGKALLALLAVISIIGYRELSFACGVRDSGRKPNAPEKVGIASTIIWYLLMALNGTGHTTIMAWGFALIIISIMAYMTVYVIAFPQYNAGQIMAAFFSFIYCPIMISFIYLIRDLEYGIYLIWMVFVCSWICDIFAYLVGVRIGKHKFAPKLSPKKSIEGSIGGVLGAAAVGAVYAWILLVPRIQTGSSGLVITGIAVISALGALISMIGDLAASAVKRNHDIKDYGKLIPGHGGIMDRFDSVIFVAPVVYGLSLMLLKYVVAL